MALARVTVLGSLAAAAALGPPAGAATYDQYACRLPGGGAAPAGGFVAVRDGSVTAAAVGQCTAGGSLDAALSGPGAAGWRYVPPPQTTIAAVSIRRRVTIPAGSHAAYALAGSDDRCDAASVCGEGRYDLGVPAGGLDFRLTCSAEPCEARLSVEAVRITLADTLAPQLVAPPTGDLLAGGALHGVRSVAFDATDEGGGVHEAALVVDGAERARRPVAGCREPFTRGAACPLRAHGTLRLDTRTLPDGPHTIALVVYDATGVNHATFGPVSVTLANRRVPAPAPPPLGRRRPAVVLTASRARLRVGQSLRLVARVGAPLGTGRAHAAFQVRIARRWRTFAVRPLGRDGRARVVHRFHATFRRLRYRFRVVVAGRRSRAVGVLVN